MASVSSRTLPGNVVEVSAAQEVPLKPREVLAVLCDADSPRIFRSVERICWKKALADDEACERSIISQIGRWRLNRWLTGTFCVGLLVTVDRNANTMTVRQVRLPREAEAVEEEAALGSAAERGAFGAFEGVWSCLDEGESSCRVTLAHRVKLAFLPPPPLDRLVRRIAEGVIRDLYADLVREAMSRACGKATSSVSRVELLDDYLDAERRRHRRRIGAAAVLLAGATAAMRWLAPDTV